jgi:FtsP/CotA-like multicopper oxidase with cupredoxin domain
MAGFFIVSSKQKDGGCGEPWNLEDIEERHMMLSDKVLDSQCQMYIDYNVAHTNGLYGDINMVNGNPFPNMPMKPQWYRFRFLNAAVTRPYKLRIKDENLNDISASKCWVIAGDGGFRQEPESFPQEGLIMGIAERYEVVCDLTGQRGKTLYWYNEQDLVNFKDVPFFCWTHLVARMVVEDIEPITTPAFEKNLVVPTSLIPVATALDSDDIAAATAMAFAPTPQYHREMAFNRKGGLWTINDQTWGSFKVCNSLIAALADFYKSLPHPAPANPPTALYK